MSVTRGISKMFKNVISGYGKSSIKPSWEGGAKIIETGGEGRLIQFSKEDGISSP